MKFTKKIAVLKIFVLLDGNIFATPYTSLDLAHNLLSDWLWVPILYLIQCKMYIIGRRGVGSSRLIEYTNSFPIPLAPPPYLNK